MRMLNNGPARCFPGEFNPRTREFLIHYLIEGEPVCKFKTENKFILMEVPINEIADWKKCTKCFAPGKDS
jgi:hypothetical protein